MDGMGGGLWVAGASRGNSSENGRAVVRVLMGLNMLRTRSGASGLGSHRSRWLGPPWRYSRMTLLARPKPGPRLPLGAGTALACCWKPRMSASVKPRIAEPPTRNRSRRVTPSHVSFPDWPGITSIACPPGRNRTGQGLWGPNMEILTKLWGRINYERKKYLEFFTLANCAEPGA